MDTVSDPTAPSLRRSTNLWFSNDTLVLQAEDMVFRVSESLLTTRSSVFRDMVAFPQGLNQPEQMDGSPVVRLHDAATDVEVFLRAIFDSSYFMPPPADVDLADLLGILRLAHKYDVGYLFRRALDHLATWYPYRLEDYYHSGTVIYADSNTTAAHLKVIKVATEVGALWILPVAYYRVCSMGVADILDSGGAHWEIYPRNSSGHVSSLTRHLLAGCSLCMGSSGFDAPAQMPACVGCGCRLASRGSLTRDHYCVGFLAWDGFWDIFTGRADCTPCITAGKEGYKTALVKFWDDLPRMFSLPSWSELEVLRLATFGLSVRPFAFFGGSVDADVSYVGVGVTASDLNSL
ncbi:hypothetical protein B0H11DRAFT_1752382 [Mycena galericulata]|nr:hypothetical protein B0H11DRAFT_1752382 [Mycena galericulata]